MTRVIDGTWEEIKAREAEFIGHRLRLVVDFEPDEPIADLPAPPFAVRDRQHLEALLIEGLQGPMHEVTKDTWAERLARIDAHASQNRP